MVPGSSQAKGDESLGEAIVVVSGLPRSGTSMTMKMLAQGGIAVVTDGIRAADESNPLGYFELENVKELDRAGEQSWLQGARGKAVKIISYLLPHLPDSFNYRVLFMHRDPREMMASQNKMLVLRGEPTGTDDERMLDLFENHTKKVKQVIAVRPCFNVIDIDYRAVLEQPLQHATRMNDFVGGGLDVERMAAAVDPTLYRNRSLN